MDLDYLERGGGGTLTVGGAPSLEPSPDSLDLVKVVLLGAPAVGKTSIIQVIWMVLTDSVNLGAASMEGAAFASNARALLTVNSDT